jgi:hypothetical protein
LLNIINVLGHFLPRSLMSATLLLSDLAGRTWPTLGKQAFDSGGLYFVRRAG